MRSLTMVCACLLAASPAYAVDFDKYETSDNQDMFGQIQERGRWVIEGTRVEDGARVQIKVSDVVGLSADRIGLRSESGFRVTTRDGLSTRILMQGPGQADHAVVRSVVDGSQVEPMVTQAMNLRGDLNNLRGLSRLIAKHDASVQYSPIEYRAVSQNPYRVESTVAVGYTLAPREPLLIADIPAGDIRWVERLPGLTRIHASRPSKQLFRSTDSYGVEIKNGERVAVRRPDGTLVAEIAAPMSMRALAEELAAHPKIGLTNPPGNYVLALGTTSARVPRSTAGAGADRPVRARTSGQTKGRPNRSKR